MIDISTITLIMTVFISVTGKAQIANKNTSDYKSVKVNGMEFSWAFHNDYLYCSAAAPTTGWVAIGFNTENELTGTNLIMGSVINSKVIIEDEFIVKPGDHQKVMDLGGSDSLMQKIGKELHDSTTISFAIPVSVNDKYHHNLIEGREYYVLLAYSERDDFQHHSIMRKTIKIKL
jgi:hypothetical protein